MGQTTTRLEIQVKIRSLYEIYASILIQTTLKKIVYLENIQFPLSTFCLFCLVSIALAVYFYNHCLSEIGEFHLSSLHSSSKEQFSLQAGCRQIVFEDSLLTNFGHLDFLSPEVKCR